MNRPAKAIPTWLADHLATTLGVDPRGVGRRARTATCPTCQRPVLRGLDHDRTAGVATVDPSPLNPLGEALALLDGRSTYDLAWRGRYELDHRNQWVVAKHPPSSSRCVVTEHRCHVAPLPTLDVPDPRPANAPRSADAPAY